jgi:hypothetical protein
MHNVKPVAGPRIVMRALRGSKGCPQSQTTDAAHAVDAYFHIDISRGIDIRRQPSDGLMTLFSWDLLHLWEVLIDGRWRAGTAGGLAGFIPTACSTRGDAMNSDQLTGSLMFMTLGVVLLVAIGSFLWFLRSRRNRDAMKKGLDMDR